MLATLAVVLAAGAVTMELWELVACGVAIAAFGLIDDLLRLKASTKLIIQIVVASALLFFGFRLNWTQSLVGDAMLTLFWIVGITNALNLLDNMDGLCGGVTLVAGGFLLVGFARQPDMGPAALYLATLLGATAGFLVYNVHPASIFLGDAGSLFLGFNLAALTLLSRPEAVGKSGVLSAVAAPVLLLLVPILDTTLVTAARLLSGRRPSQGGRDHSSHRLVAVGLSEPRAVATLCMLAAAGGAASLLLQRRDQSWPLIVSLTFVLGMILFAVYLARIRVYDHVDPGRSLGDSATPLVVNFMYKRRVAEVLLDLCLVPLVVLHGLPSAIRRASLRRELSVVPAVAAGRAGLAVVRAVHGGRLPRHVALLRDDGRRRVRQGRPPRDCRRRAGHPLPVPVRELLAIGVRHLRGDPAAAAGRDARVVPPDGRIRPPSAVTGTALRDLRHRRRQPGLTIHEVFGAVPLKIVGFIDDNPMTRRTRVGGYSVLGGFDVLSRLVAGGHVDCVVLNTHLLDLDHLQRLEEACRDADVELLRLHVNLKPLSAVS